MEREKFEKLVHEALKNLPKLFRDKLRNIDIVVEDEPVVHKSLLGLYQGVPLKRRGFWYGNVMPDKITLFQKNIERLSQNDEEIKEWVNRVLIHEIGHFFGFSEEKLRENGY
ncbi:MAG: metallopeptidase family protein [candidate division WOR-3 bacterium]|nr:MAG: metallopeptidase family protein [candidate division WOR-3 bacterium]